MELKEDYKQTEVGVIPETWDVVELQNTCRDKITYGIVQCGPHVDTGVPYIRVSDMNDRELDITGMLRTSPKIAARFPRSTVEEGDIVYALRGKLGEVRPVKASVAGANLTQGTARLAPFKDVSSDYLLWSLRSPNVLKQADIQAKGTTFREITLADLRQLLVALPATKVEQEAIAEMLIDADALIESFEQLIAKKSQIKQGAMQELLTGKKRLPGFEVKPGRQETEIGKIPKDWDIQFLGKNSAITTGRKDVNEGNPDGTYPFFTCSRNYTFSDSFSFDLEAILIAGNGDVGNLHYFSGKFEAYQRTYVVHHFTSHVKFIWYQLDYRLIESLGLGTIGTSIPYIKKENLTEFRFPSPTSKTEQIAIAEILSDIDTEIVALKTRLTKAQQVKRGMMQELLSGRIRLIQPKDSHA